MFKLLRRVSMTFRPTAYTEAYETEVQLSETVELVMRADHVYVLSSCHNALVWPQGVRLWIRNVNEYCGLCCGHETLSRVQKGGWG